jgi:hypothetical protein
MSTTLATIAAVAAEYVELPAIHISLAFYACRGNLPLKNLSMVKKYEPNGAITIAAVKNNSFAKTPLWQC